MGGSARHALAAGLLVVSLGGGSRVGAATDDPPGKALAAVAADPAPDAAHAARPTRRWIVEGTSFEPSLVDPIRRRMYLFDSQVHAPFAASTETGARLWTARPAPAADPPPMAGRSPLDAPEADPRFLDLLPPVARPHVGGRPRPGLVDTVLRRAGDTLLVSEMKTLTAYDLESGALLWTRPEPCRLKEAGGEFAWLSCSRPGSITVITARSGKSVLASRRSSFGEEATLGPHALLLFSKDDRRLTSRPLDRAGASWSVTLPSERVRVHSYLIFGRHDVVVTGGVVVVVGETVIGVDPRTGRALWRSPASGCDTAAALGQELGL
ncbi:MAG TPA: PQQ-binding-like beta-propeller repeat protein, partial [Polyangiaceae bacterium]|nr:PQQ-binding-like beta-propeller repeat protein [Polyangiaceae bacterium]